MQNLKRYFPANSIYQSLNRSFSRSKHARLNHITVPAKNPKGEPLNLVVLHGLLGSAPNFRGIVSSQKISQHANSYLVDLRNHGSSEHRDTMSTREMAGDVYNFVKENNLDSNLVVLGHSMGARVAMTFSLLYPEVLKAAVIVDLAPFNYGSDPRFKVMGNTQNLIKKLAAIDMDLSYKEIAEKIKEASGDQTVANFVMTNLKKEDNSDKFNWKSNIPVINKNYKDIVGAPEGDGKKFEGPVKVIFGGISDYYSPDLIPLFHNVFPKFDEKRDLAIIPEAGHWVHFAKPYEFIDEVSGFLDKLE